MAIIEGDPGTTSSMERVTGFANAAKEGDLTLSRANPRTGIAKAQARGEHLEG